MKIISLYTPMHAPLVEEHFLPSARRHFGAANVDCRLVESAPEGVFGTPEFVSWCQQRLLRYAAVCEESDEPVVLSDADVRFYGDVPSDLEAHAGKHVRDAYFQWDGVGGHCMGFVYVRRRDVFAALTRQISDLVEQRPELDDQVALKILVHRGEVRASLGILPTWRYWTSGTGGHVWVPGDPLRPPGEILMHHANWAFGVPHKLALLSEVARIREVRSGSQLARP